MGDDQVKEIAPVVENTRHSIQTSVLTSATTSACVGISLLEVVEPLTNLVEVIMMLSQWSDIELSVATAIDCDRFHLGDEAKSVIMDAFRRRSLHQYVGNVGNLIVDAWKLHQIDDKVSIACGEAVLEFVQKYKKWNRLTMILPCSFKLEIVISLPCSCERENVCYLDGGHIGRIKW